MLEGELYNPLFRASDQGEIMGKFRWSSHILSGKGGFEHIGEGRLEMISNKRYRKGETVSMSACEMHTIQIEKGQKCVWLIEEAVPSCEYLPVNYSPNDLTQWTPEGLYIEVGDDVKEKYIGKYFEF